MEDFKEQEKYLKEWLSMYVRHKDIIKKEIRKIEDKKSPFIIHYDNKKEYCFFQPILGDIEFTSHLAKEDFITIVTFNMKENLDDLSDLWKKAVLFKNLKIIFINPDSITEQKWIINPYIHNKFCDKDALKQGLETLFQSTDPLVRADINKFRIQ